MSSWPGKLRFRTHHVGGLDIYTAVLDDGIRTLDQFAAWLARRPEQTGGPAE
jgi:hypothetical protein